jgi:4-hydroxybenzoate polyprenyltransferase
MLPIPLSGSMPWRIFNDSIILWRISRPQNIGIAFLVFLEALWMSADKNWFPLHDTNTWLLIALVMTVMSAGYWVNDLYDYKIDLINKPHRTFISIRISSKKIWTAWFVAWIAVCVIGWLLPIRMQFLLQATWIFLFLYARYFKRMPVIGNVIVASMAAALVLTASAWLYTLTFNTLCLAIFSFQSTLLREIIKDMEDIRGDIRYKLKTLPIVVGIKTSRNIVFVLLMVFILSCWFPVVVGYMVQKNLNLYFMLAMLLLVQIPSFRLLYLLSKATHAPHFAQMSALTKWIMLGGMLALLLL